MEYLAGGVGAVALLACLYSAIGIVEPRLPLVRTRKRAALMTGAALVVAGMAGSALEQSQAREPTPAGKQQADSVDRTTLSAHRAALDALQRESDALTPPCLQSSDLAVAVEKGTLTHEEIRDQAKALVSAFGQHAGGSKLAGDSEHLLQAVTARINREPTNHTLPLEMYAGYIQIACIEWQKEFRKRLQAVSEMR